MGQFGVYARNDEHRKSAEPEVMHGSVPARWDTLEWLWSAPCESVQPVYRWPAASLEASVASEAAAWRQCDPGSGRRLWPGCSRHAVACRKSPPVCHSTVHCSSPAWKRRYCTRLSGRRRQSVNCARGAEHECGSCRPVQRFSRDLDLLMHWIRQTKSTLHRGHVYAEEMRLRVCVCLCVLCV